MSLVGPIRVHAGRRERPRDGLESPIPTQHPGLLPRGWVTPGATDPAPRGCAGARRTEAGPSSPTALALPLRPTYGGGDQLGDVAPRLVRTSAPCGRRPEGCDAGSRGVADRLGVHSLGVNLGPRADRPAPRSARTRARSRRARRSTASPHVKRDAPLAPADGAGRRLPCDDVAGGMRRCGTGHHDRGASTDRGADRGANPRIDRGTYAGSDHLGRSTGAGPGRRSDNRQRRGLHRSPARGCRDGGDDPRDRRYGRGMDITGWANVGTREGGAASRCCRPRYLVTIRQV